jgi:hypothetical protein
MKKSITVEMNLSDSFQIAQQMVNPKYPFKEELVNYLANYIVSEETMSDDLIKLHNGLRLDYFTPYAQMIERNDLLVVMVATWADWKFNLEQSLLYEDLPFTEEDDKRKYYIPVTLKHHNKYDKNLNVVVFYKGHDSSGKLFESERSIKLEWLHVYDGHSIHKINEYFNDIQTIDL